jgi:hypothetical protein
MTQRALGARAQAKLRGELPEAGRDTRELIRDRVRPAQVVDRLGFNGMQVNESHEKCAKCLQKRPEMRLVEPRRVLPDFRTTLRTRSSRFRTLRLGARDRAGAISVPALMASVQAVACLSAAVAPGASRASPRPWPCAAPL